MAGLTIGGAFNLKGQDMANALSGPNRDFVVRTIVGDWNASDRISGRTRRAMKELLPHTVMGGLLSHLHPGMTTVYRGSDHEDESSSPRSWSKSPSIAKGFGKHLFMQSVFPHQPALDVTKAIGRSEHEVILHHGGHKHSKLSPEQLRAIFAKESAGFKGKKGHRKR